jgi:hypothetical protein
MIYIQTGFAPDPDLNHARIGYENLAFGLTPTASSAATGHPAIAATYPTTFDYWEPTSTFGTWTIDFGTAKTIDFVGLLGDFGPTVFSIQHSPNAPADGGFVTIAFPNLNLDNLLTDRINMFLFAPVNARSVRLNFLSTAPVKLAVAYIGKALAMQRKIYQGHTPLTLSRETELSNNVSEGGQYLGRSIIRKGASTSAEWQHLKAAWYRANFDPFVKSAREYPFFIGWRPQQYPNELGFVWTGGDLSPQVTGPRDFMSVGMSFRGLINE